MQGVGITDQDTLSSAFTNTNHNGGRRCQPQGTRARDNENRYRSNDACVPVPQPNACHKERQQRQYNNERHKPGRHFIDKRLDRRTRALSLCDQSGNTRQYGAAPHAGDPTDQHTVAIKGSGINLVIKPLFYGHRLPGEHGFGHGRVTRSHHAINRNGFSAQHAYTITGPDMSQGNGFKLPLGLFKPGGFRRQMQQAFYG